jgi:hypothetical protein
MVMYFAWGLLRLTLVMFGILLAISLWVLPYFLLGEDSWVTHLWMLGCLAVTLYGFAVWHVVSLDTSERGRREKIRSALLPALNKLLLILILLPFLYGVIGLASGNI